MKTHEVWLRTGRYRKLLLSSIAVALAFSPGAPAATVTNCTEPDLRLAMAAGGTVTFACDGIIVVTNTITNYLDIVLDGTAHQVTLSGGRSTRVFCLNPNVTTSLVNLTIADGSSSSGGGIFLDGGTLNLTGVQFTGNAATNPAGVPSAPPVCGGAIYNRGGTVNATNCTFLGNTADQTGVPPVAASGGAIYSLGGLMNLSQCVFSGNCATEVHAPMVAVVYEGPPARGGAVYNTGSLWANGCTFFGNSAVGGAGNYIPPMQW